MSYQKIDEITETKFQNWQKERDVPNASELGNRVAYFLHLWLGGLHNADYKHLAKVDWSNKYIIEFSYRGDLHTFDFNALTKIVLLSHDLKLRVEIMAQNIKLLKLTFHQRQRGDDLGINERMPFIEDHIATIRNGYGFDLPAAKKATGSRSSKPISLEQAVKILNAGKFRPKGSIELTWRAENDQAIGFLNDHYQTIHTTISKADAIHRSRQLIRRCPPISDFAEKIADILEIANHL